VTREPGDLPLIRFVAGRGASALADSVRHPGSGRLPLRSDTRVTSIQQPGVTETAAAAEAAVVYVCVTCRHPGGPGSEPRPGSLLAGATAEAAAGTGVVVRRVRCLANCTRGLSAAVRCAGSWTYVFGGLDVGCGAALVAGARLLASAADGIMPWRGRPEPLKRGLIARVPPLNFEEME
jgi:predicted metal-binding protein